ncbi:hypothetical protein DMENIID0001_044890 [Sergentomyia squamirostris]
MNDGGNCGSAMSGPHSRLGQPPNTSSWNHLQVPSYIPRQPQLAHLSTDPRPMTWHTPTPPPTDNLFNYMATNHKNPLEINPIMPTFASSSSPFGGTMDLTVSSSLRNSSSPRNLQHSPHKNASSPNPGVIQGGLPKEKNNGEITGTLFVRDAKQINNDVVKLTNLSAPAEPVELVKEPFHNPMMKNNTAKCNSPVQPPALPTRQSPAPSVTPPVINQPNNLSSASTGKEITAPGVEHTTPHISPPPNQSNTSTEDSVDSNGGRKRRKRKPNKTQKMEKQPEEEETEEQMNSAVPCEIPQERRLSETPLPPVSAIGEPVANEESVMSPGKTVETSPKRRSRRKGADDAEPVETIDMIAITESHSAAEETTHEVPRQEQATATKENGLVEEKTTEFDDVENKLEQMFAGIDDRPTMLTNTTMEETPSGSKMTPQKGRKRALSKDEDPPKPKKRRRGRKGAKASVEKITAADKKKKGKRAQNEVGSSSIPETPCSTPKFRGPFVQVRTGGVTCVINTPQTEEEGQAGKKNLHNQASNERRKIRGLHVSTLSTRYDADTTDTTWMCVFCKYGPHKMGLGDLFGPYTVTTKCEDFQLSQMDAATDDFKSKRTKSTMIQRKPHCLPVVAASSREDSSCSSTSVGKKKKKTAPGDSTEVLPDIYAGMGRLNEETLEVWLHEDCIVWAPDVHLVGSRLVGFEAAVWSATRHLCILCGKNGASVGCLERGCREMIHMPCAKQSNWSLSNEDFKSHCVRHSPGVSARINGDT